MFRPISLSGQGRWGGRRRRDELRKGGEEKEEEERDVGRLRSHGGHPGPRGGGGALPLSYIYPLATVRLAG